MMDKKVDKNELVAEYLKGGISLRKLARKYGVNHRQIHRWVKELGERGGGSSAAKDVRYTGEQVAEIKRLRKELEDARLKNELLVAMIDIAEEQMGIDIRKKRGAKR
jgi:transposase-like protein